MVAEASVAEGSAVAAPVELDMVGIHIASFHQIIYDESHESDIVHLGGLGLDIPRLLITIRGHQHERRSDRRKLPQHLAALPTVAVQQELDRKRTAARWYLQPYLQLPLPPMSL